MESKISVFSSSEFGDVRVVMRENEPWFVAKDVCECLDLQRVDSACRNLEDDEKDTHSMSTPRGTQKMTVISEAGLYSLILTSRKPSAKQFKRWVTHEVIPSIRKHGVYATDNFIDKALNDPDSMIKVLEALKDERAKLAASVAENAKLSEQLNVAEGKLAVTTLLHKEACDKVEQLNKTKHMISEKREAAALAKLGNEKKKTNKLETELKESKDKIENLETEKDQLVSDNIYKLKRIAAQEKTIKTQENTIYELNQRANYLADENEKLRPGIFAKDIAWIDKFFIVNKNNRNEIHKKLGLELYKICKSNSLSFETIKLDNGLSLNRYPIEAVNILKSNLEKDGRLMRVYRKSKYDIR